jgi:hypothetical protein
MLVFALVLIAVATVAAVRGVWSPCGLSMLSSITPMTEAGRGNRFAVTAGWFVAGGVVGGLSLGLLAAAGAGAVAALDLSVTTRAAVGATLAVATAAVDLGLTGIGLPIFKRQVNDAWLRTYRSWVYGAGFGWQIGFGLATYIMTAGVILTAALAVVGGEPVLALAACTTFGLVRGLAVLVGRGATSPDRLAAVHARLDRWAVPSRAAAAGVQVLAAGGLTAVAAGAVPGGAVTVVLVGAWAISSRVSRPRTREGAGSPASHTALSG